MFGARNCRKFERMFCEFLALDELLIEKVVHPFEFYGFTTMFVQMKYILVKCGKVHKKSIACFL
jgi:hypothetical protein